MPHIHPIGATFSIIILVRDAIPKEWLRQLAEERKTELARIKSSRHPDWQKRFLTAQQAYDLRFDDLLRSHASQDHPLADKRAATILVERLKKFDGELYDLYAYSVMSNHVHLEIDLSVQLTDSWDGVSVPPGYVNIPRIMQLIKGGSSYYINKATNRPGRKLWSARYRDRFIRNDNHLKAACEYTWRNPVAAGLYTSTGLHPFTGGMSPEEIDKRLPRRVYPDPAHWVAQYLDKDKGWGDFGKRST